MFSSSLIFVSYFAVSICSRNSSSSIRRKLKTLLNVIIVVEVIHIM